jgi:hypothetical protein
MKVLFAVILTVLALTQSVFGKITYTLAKEKNPTADQKDAYTRIAAAMDKAVMRWERFPNVTKSLYVSYNIGVQTADGSYNGGIRFGANRGFMQERTALHEMAHALGVGQTWKWNNMCATGSWNQTAKVLRTFDGSRAKVNCGGGHFWPYGLNYDNEFSNTNAYRHVSMVEAMLRDGM